MADTTPTYDLPFLELGDAPDIASGLEDLATAVETELIRIDADVAKVNGLSTVVASDTNTEGPYSNTTATSGTNVCGVAFTAPASGAVLVHWKADFWSSQTDKVSFVSMEVRTGATVTAGAGSGSQVVASNSNDALKVSGTVTSGVEARLGAGTFRLITGLTPGNSYHVRLMHFTEASGNITVFYRQVVVQPML
ncbi:hypothetical protein [Kribbella jiaozuonensis]|uniref:Uncharacterized protein n=1 Tax=Kribbella jiaozuonensis TaxID=2575441 RepID=A0A4U3LT53_9ACTN|nr:hypothetical protein [Kribbella jiaozuonensis]TKK79191.1 hypothetical protein FDA38_12235 [Kribbella jiaozuonensis]TKK83261.1 hypothetical protein FDA38_11190 [Kribbella jiaozuonensis]